MKLTLFTLPRRFEGPFATIQHNALASWHALQPTPELILFGNEIGTAEAANRYRATHLPSLERNALGTPLVNHLFTAATLRTHTRYQGFVNTDIILDPGLTALTGQIMAWHPRALIISRRWDFDLNEPIDFSNSAAFPALASRARHTGALYDHHGMDVFIFPTGQFDTMPPFSVGWPGAKYDNWLVYAARRAHLPVVDVSYALTNLHQNHPTGTPNPAKAKEHEISLDLLGGHGCCYNVLDATHTAMPDGRILPNPRHLPDFKRQLFRFAQRLRYRVRRRLFGFTYAKKT